jgi:hypothetical protein
MNDHRWLLLLARHCWMFHAVPRASSSRSRASVLFRSDRAGSGIATRAPVLHGPRAFRRHRSLSNGAAALSGCERPPRIQECSHRRAPQDRVPHIRHRVFSKFECTTPVARVDSKRCRLPRGCNGVVATSVAPRKSDEPFVKIEGRNTPVGAIRTAERRFDSSLTTVSPPGPVNIFFENVSRRLNFCSFLAWRGRNSPKDEFQE